MLRVACGEIFQLSPAVSSSVVVALRFAKARGGSDPFIAALNIQRKPTNLHKNRRASHKKHPVSANSLCNRLFRSPISREKSNVLEILLLCKATQV